MNVRWRGSGHFLRMSTTRSGKKCISLPCFEIFRLLNNRKTIPYRSSRNSHNLFRNFWYRFIWKCPPPPSLPGITYTFCWYIICEIRLYVSRCMKHRAAGVKKLAHCKTTQKESVFSFQPNYLPTALFLYMERPTFFCEASRRRQKEKKGNEGSSTTLLAKVFAFFRQQLPVNPSDLGGRVSVLKNLKVHLLPSFASCYRSIMCFLREEW